MFTVIKKKIVYRLVFLLLGLSSLLIGGIHLKLLFAEQINKSVCDSANNNSSISDQRKAIRLNKYNPTYLANLSCLYAQQDSIDITLFDSLLIGKHYVINSYLDSSLCYSLKAWSIVPNDQLFALNSAILTAVKGNVEIALEMLSPFISDGSAIGEVLCVGGLFEELVGTSYAASSLYSRGIIIKPAITESRFFKELSCRNKQLFEQSINKAIFELEKIFSIATDPIVAAKLGRLFLEKNEIDRAKELLECALNELPTLGRTWYNMGIIAEIEGDVEKAKNCYWKSYALDSSDLLPLNKLASYDKDLIENVEALKRKKISHQAYRLKKMYGGTTFNYPYVVAGFEQYFDIY